jgi:hypothetical protein
MRSVECRLLGQRRNGVMRSNFLCFRSTLGQLRLELPEPSPRGGNTLLGHYTRPCWIRRDWGLPLLCTSSQEADFGTSSPVDRSEPSRYVVRQHDGTGLIRTKLVDLLSHGALLFVEASRVAGLAMASACTAYVAMTLSWEYLRSERVVSQIAGFNE